MKTLLLLALMSGNDTGRGAVLFYLLTYAVTNLGAFGIITVLEQADRPNDQVRDYAGLWNERPGLAALMAIFLLSLGGFPPFGGFIAKWYIFTASMEAGYTWLAIIGVLASVVGAYYYLRIIKIMYFDEPVARFQPMPVEEQVASIYAGTRGYLDGLPVNRVGEFEKAMLDALRAEGSILSGIRDKREITKEIDDKMKAFLADFTKKFA